MVRYLVRALKLGRNSCIELYRPGHFTFEEGYEQSLAGILKSWLGMVERRDWIINPDGVVGGINAWKESDAQGGWEKYVIPHLTD